MGNNPDPIDVRAVKTQKFGMSVTPVAPNVLATGTEKTVDNVITELQRLGLVTQS